MKWTEATAVLPNDRVKAEQVSRWVRWALKTQGRNWTADHEAEYCQGAGLVAHRALVSLLRVRSPWASNAKCDGCGSWDDSYIGTIDLRRISVPMATTRDEPFDVTRTPHPATEEELKDTVKDTIGVVYVEFLLCPTCELRVDLMLETARVVSHGRSWEEMRRGLENEVGDHVGSHGWDDAWNGEEFVHKPRE